MWQALGIFVGGSWAGLQVVDLFIDRGYLPEWVFGAVLLVLVVGLPIVVVTAYLQGGVSRDPVAHDPEEADSAVSRLLTWRRVTAGGVAAFALLGLLTTGYLAMRATGIGAPGTLVAQGVLTDGAELVLADFGGGAGENVTGELVTEALRIDLGQSDAFTLVANSVINAGLERMQRAPAEGLPESVAVELAAREGAEGVVSGDVARVGDAILLTARVLAPGSGDELASFRTTAEGDEELLDAIDDLSGEMRSKIGESLRSVAASDALPDVSTHSLEALERYSAAAHGSDRGLISASVAVRMYEEAVALDSTFAAAHLAIAVTLANYGGDRERAAEAARAAWRHRGHLPASERLETEAAYHAQLGDPRDAIEAFRSILALEPDAIGATTNLTHLLNYRGRYTESVEHSSSLSAWDTQPFVWNYMAALTAVGRHADARAVIDSMESALPAHPYHRSTRALQWLMAGRADSATAVLGAGTEEAESTTLSWERYVAAMVLIRQGRLESAYTALDEVERLAGETAASLQLINGLATPWAMALLADDPAAARADLEALHDRLGWREMTAYNRELSLHAMTWALLDAPDRAREALSDFAAVAPNADPWGRSNAAMAEALLLAYRGDPTAASKLASARDAYFCIRCADAVIAFGYEWIGATDEAIAAWERYLAEPFFDATSFILHIFPPAAHERLAHLYDERGDSTAAVAHYRAFADMWSDADPVLQPRVELARRRVAERATTN